MRFPLLTKTLAIVAVLFLLSLVLLRIDGLVNERRWRSVQAAQSVEQSLAGAQTLVGPVLQRSCTEQWTEWAGEGKERRKVEEKREWVLAAAPQGLKVDGDLKAEARYRGLFKVNGYAGRVVLDARWPDLAALQPRAEHADSRVSCTPVRVWLAASDVRGLRSAQATVDGAVRPVLPGTPNARHTRGLQLVLDELRSAQAGTPLAVKLTLELLGTTRLALVPAGAETSWALRSDWPHPSFGGRFLPAARKVEATGFTANWTVSALASPAAADVVRDGEVCPVPQAASYGAYGDDVELPPPATTGTNNRPCLDTLAVTFIDPVNPYVLTDRATKYAWLFIILTFGAVGLTEVLAGRRVHPVQYTLVGLALAMFFLLLLSLSEHINFGSAYAAASGACVALLGFYARHMLGSSRAGAAFGAGAAVLYGALWVLLQMEQTALVIGSLMLFAALAAVMVLTRRVDWYALFGAMRKGGPLPAPMHG
jgi:inner membrane protein